MYPRAPSNRITYFFPCLLLIFVLTFILMMATLTEERKHAFAHQALGIPEIICTAFEELEQEDRKGTLTSAAQLCRFFTEPALDMVWRDLDVGIIPLLSILPLTNKARTLVCTYA